MKIKDRPKTCRHCTAAEIIFPTNVFCTACGSRLNIEGECPSGCGFPDDVPEDNYCCNCGNFLSD